MITLQADPLIEWDETNLDFFTQSEDVQNWVQNNILNTESINVMETVARESGRGDLTRIKKQTYTTEDFNLVVDRTFRSNENCALLSSTYTLNIL